MNLSKLDRHPSYSAGAGPLAMCLQRLATMLTSPAVQWDPAQRAAAQADLTAAFAVMGADVLTLAGIVHTRQEPEVPCEFVVPVHGTSGEADWDSLVRGKRGPWGLDGSGGWGWRRVVVFDTPRLRAIDPAEGSESAQALRGVLRVEMDEAREELASPLRRVA